MAKVAGKRKRDRNGRSATDIAGSQRCGSNTRKKRKTHSKQGKPFACAICSYRAARKDHLTKHMRTHTNEKPYACTICSYRATQKSEHKDSKRVAQDPSVSISKRRRCGNVVPLLSSTSMENNGVGVASSILPPVTVYV